MAVKLDLGKQLACKIVDLRSIRRKEKKRLIQLAADKEAKKGRYSSISSTRSKRQSSEMAKQIAEGSVNKIAREVEILKNVSHVSQHQARLLKQLSCLSYSSILTLKVQLDFTSLADLLIGQYYSS